MKCGLLFVVDHFEDDLVIFYFFDFKFPDVFDEKIHLED